MSQQLTVDDEELITWKNKLKKWVKTDFFFHKTNKKKEENRLETDIANLANDF